MDLKTKDFTFQNKIISIKRVTKKSIRFLQFQRVS